MRHGVDPDHLAIINGINLNNHKNGKSISWSGFFFSLGHGLTVTLIGLFIIAFHEGSQSFTPLLQITEWIPIALLLFTGLYGIYTLFINSTKKDDHHCHNKILDILNNSKYPSLRLFFTGFFFALIFDTSTQVAAWGLIGHDSTQNLYLVAILIGMSFTIGMIFTDTLNGLFFYRILHANHSAFNLKLFLSILIILSSLIIGGIQLLSKLGYTIEIPEHFRLFWGLLIMLTTIAGVLINFYYSKKQALKI